jgi:hypothetical protein
MDIPGLPPLEIKHTIWKDLEDFQKFMSEFHAEITDPAQKQMFGQMLDELQKARAEAEELAPGVVQDLQRDAEKTKAEADEFAKEVEQARAQAEQWEKDLAEAKKKMEEAPPVPPEVPIEPAPVVDPHLGMALGKELLEALGTAGAVAAGATSGKDLGSVASAWADVNDGTEPAPPAKKTTPSEKVAAQDLNRSVVEDEAPQAPAKPKAPKKSTSGRKDVEKEIWESGISELEDE